MRVIWPSERRVYVRDWIGDDDKEGCRKGCRKGWREMAKKIVR